jgi:hypothetical protein
MDFLELQQELEIHLILTFGADRDYTKWIEASITAIDFFWDKNYDDLIFIPDGLGELNGTRVATCFYFIEALDLNYWLPVEIETGEL